MIAAIYRFMLKPHQEKSYQQDWHLIASYFKKHRGAIGSCLHKGDAGLWCAYSRWPDEQTRQASWPGEDAPSSTLPDEIQTAILRMQALRKENDDLEKFDEICLEVRDDLLV